MLYKRFESGSFQWPRNGVEARELSPQQYQWLMEGLSVEQPKAHRPVRRQTMSNWMMWSAEHLLAPVYERLHRELLTRDVLHAYETTLQVLHEPGKTAQSKSYMWLYRTGGDTDSPIMLYEYQPWCGACYPKAFLAGFKGYLHTDDYSGYHSLPDEVTVIWRGSWPLPHIWIYPCRSMSSVSCLGMLQFPVLLINSLSHAS